MKKGFSVVEILMSLAIVGTLLTLSLPAFNVVRNKHLNSKYQSAVHSVHTGIQHVVKVYYKLDYTENALGNPLTLANMNTFDLQDKNWSAPENADVDVTERFNIAPLQKGKQTFCTQLSSVINTIDTPDCDPLNTDPDDLTFIAANGVSYYGLNQPFPGGVNDYIDVRVVLKDEVYDDNKLDDSQYNIRIHPDGRIEPDPTSTKAQEIILVSYLIIKVPDADRAAVINKLVAMKGITAQKASELLMTHNAVSTLITYKDYLADKAALDAVATHGDIMYAHYFYKPKVTDFTF